MMTRIVKILFGLLVVAGLASTTVQVASAQTGGERIVSFNAAATLDRERMFTVTETIVYDFGSGQRHGIERYIPERYSRNGGDYRLHLEVKQVLMDGKSIEYSIKSRSPELKIRIGDPDEFVTGRHEYRITYATRNAINFFDDHDELYWNVTGNGWPVPIESVSFSVRGPDGFDASTAKEECFVGVYGATERACGVTTQGASVSYVSNRALGANEGMTAVLGIPKGLILAPTWQDRVWQFIADNGIIVLPFLVLFFMYRYWSVKGREPQGRGTVIPQYEPPRGLTPMEMTVLRTQNNDQRSVTATIIDLARRGYFKILYTQKKGLFGSSDSYAFEKLKEADESLTSHERTLFEGLFKGSGSHQELESLKGKFYTSITSAQSSVYSTLRKKGFFGANPMTVRASWFGIAVAVGFFGVFLSIAMHRPVIWTVAFLLCALIIAVFGWFMPQKTIEGAVALEEVEGFKWFLSVTEKDRLAFHNAPALKPETFHEFLSYAIAFGVEEQWANQFKDLSIPEPDYVSGYGHINPLLFIHSMHAFNSSFAKTFTPPSSAGSGGSGFSGGGVGGGFGGGGGGSW